MVLGVRPDEGPTHRKTYCPCLPGISPAGSRAGNVEVVAGLGYAERLDGVINESRPLEILVNLQAINEENSLAGNKPHTRDSLLPATRCGDTLLCVRYDF